MSCRTFMGMRGLPVAWAGQTELQRPHSVQAKVSRRVFQGISSTRSTPNFSASSKSIGSGRP